MRTHTSIKFSSPLSAYFMEFFIATCASDVILKIPPIRLCLKKKTKIKRAKTSKKRQFCVHYLFENQ